MNDDRNLIININNGTKLEISFPVPIRNSTAAMMEGMKRLTESDNLAVDSDGRLIVIPWTSVKQIEVSPSRRPYRRRIADHRQREHWRERGEFLSADRPDHAAGPGQSRIVLICRRLRKFVGPGRDISGPVFQGGNLRAQYHAAKANFDEAKAAYQQTVVTSFQEVSDALTTRQKLAEEYVYDRQAVVALVESVDLATQRYLNGKSSYYEVLQAQQELYPTLRAQVQTQVGELLAIVQLYQALGGGWQTVQK